MAKKGSFAILKYKIPRLPEAWGQVRYSLTCIMVGDHPTANCRTDGLFSTPTNVWVALKRVVGCYDAINVSQNDVCLVWYVAYLNEWI